MAFNDWEPDDLLDFHFENPGPKTGVKDSVKGSAENNIKNSIDDDFEVFDRLIESNRRDAAAGAQPPAAARPESGRGLGESFDYYD